MKTGNLEHILNNIVLPQKYKTQVQKEICYFDEYYMTESGLVKVFHQEFREDPYMNLSPLQEIRLIIYSSGINPEELREIFDMYVVPIITRAKKPMIDFLRNFGFEEIKSKDGYKTTLFPIKFPIPKILPPTDKHIFQVSESDLDEIEELFKNEYSLRYRMVKMMYHGCPEACFAYKDEERILGATFNEIENNELRMRQILVKREFQDKGVGTRLYEARLNFALRRGIKSAKANIRRESKKFHEKYGFKIVGKAEYYILRGI